MRLKNCTNQRKCAIIWLIITISLAFQYYASHNSFLRKISSSTNEVNLKETVVQVTTKYLNKKQQVNASKELTSINLSNSSDLKMKTNKEGKNIQTKVSFNFEGNFLKQILLNLENRRKSFYIGMYLMEI